MSTRAGYNVAVKNRFAQLDSDVDSDTETCKTVEVQKQEKRQPTKNREPLKSKQNEQGARVKFADEKVTLPAKEVDNEKPVGRRVQKRESGSGASRPQRKTIEGSRLNDRHSGTGRGREMKKKGAGSHNWGSKVSVQNEKERSGSVELGGTDTSENVADTTVKPDTAEAEPAATVKESVMQPPKDVGYAEYQRELQYKRNLLRQSDPATTNVRSVDASVFEKEGLKKYEKDETDPERAAREQRMQKLNRNHDLIDCDGEYSPPCPNVREHVFEFKRPQAPRHGGGRHGQSGQKPKRQPEKVQNAYVDLNDAATFPGLC